MAKNYEEMNTDEISNEMVEIEKRLKASETANEILELEDLRLAKEIAELQVKRKNIAPGLVQGKHNVKRLRSDKVILEKLYWRGRRG
jgi:hypothetical protein